ncbi:MAG TPA: serine/threonine-protein kinase [Polyangia bacterium]|nr:serine/threonine-protein kinase [Polyangia bacterium]
MSATEISCPKCKRGSLLLVGQAGRRVQVGGASVEVPRDFMIPTCDHCGAEQLDEQWKASLVAAVDNAKVATLRAARTEKMGIIAPAVRAEAPAVRAEAPAVRAEAPAVRAEAPAVRAEATITVTRAPSAAFAIGELIADTFEILKVIGVGGMGTVYEAHDRALNRRVALKVAQSANPELSLRKEAQALAAIRHASMVTVHSVGKHRGVEFLVMELIRGATLHEHIRKHIRAGKRFAVGDVLETLVGIAEGLAAVHASGISHRDVKPANIMLAPGNRTVLMDFGLFTPEFECLETVAGSPEYMAPEIYAATVEAGAGHLVDLYALGVIAYELLAGYPPYRGANAIETLAMQVRSPIPDITAQRTDVPRELAALLGELLAKAPGDRPQGIEDVLGRLRAIRTRLERDRARDKFVVLIVDDDRDFAETMRALVRAAVPDADVNVARDGEAALATLKKQTPAVMLLDLEMPRMNGVELCMALRGAGLAAECEIISVNGAATREDRELLMRLGVRQTVTKTPTISRTIVDLMKTSRRRWLAAAAG